MPHPDNTPHATANDIPGPNNVPPTAAVRTKVLKTAGALFATLGLNNVTLDMVAAEAKVKLPVVKEQFPTTDSVLAAALSFMGLGLEDSGFQGEHPRGWASFDRFTSILERGMNTPGLYQLYSDINVAATDPEHAAHDWLVQHHDDMLAHMTESIRTGIEDGQILADTDPRELHRQLVSFLLGVVPTWRVLGENFSLTSAFAEYKRMLQLRFATPDYLSQLSA